jgi:peptidoglycan/LPS O-acetylase OafA/YrhL
MMTASALTDNRPKAADLAPESSARTGFRPDIEGLRAVAILLVVLYHAGIRQVPGGYVGVDVFFVISGFLITSHLVGEAARSGRLNVPRFYGRRVIRLLPAATLVLASTMLAGWYWLPATRLKSLTWDAITANAYVLNYRLADLGTDYRTATATPSPLQHFWSLAVEEQFYLVIPLLLVLTMVATRSRSGFTVAVAAITAGSLWWSIHTTVGSPVWAYFGAPTRAWELGAGALLALAVPALARGTARPSDRQSALAAVVLLVAGLGAIGYAAARFGETTPFPGYHALVPVLGAIAVIGSGALRSNSLLGVPILRSIGARSYSWYLWHWPVLVIAPYAVSHELGTTGKLMAVAVAYGFACLSFVLLEQPLRADPLLRNNPARAGLTGLAMTAAVIAIALLLPLLPPRTAQGSGHAAELSLTGTTSARTKALARRISTATRVRTLPANLTPSLKKAATDDPVIARDGCLVSFTGTRTPSKCERFGDTSSRKVVVLFGDSHAAQWFPAMESIAKKRHWRLAVFTKVVCSAADVKIYLDPKRGGYQACVTWRARTEARIKAIHPSLVLMTSKVDGGDALGISGNVDRGWGQALTRTTARLTATGTRLVYLDDTPTPKGDVPDCLSAHPRAIQRCAQTREQASGSGRRSAMVRAAADAGVTVISATPWFCSAKTCPVVVGNILVYRDESHISGAYIRLLAPLLSERLKIGSTHRAVRRKG